MLSVQPLESAKGAADYYAAAFNYYAGDAQAMRWLGKGAVHLGLSGLVEKEQMLQLLQGKLPDGQMLQNKKGEHRPGFDMTFSAPKSVSILVGLGVDKDLEQFHDRAVELSIKQLEEEFAETRIVKDGRVYFEKTNNLVIAAFRQPSSRANDPALHTHAVTMNITFDKDNKARSLASDIHANRGVVEQLQRNVTYCGLLYRTHLANMLKEKGYQLTPAGDGLFEIEGMPESILKEFSTRREEIKQYMNEHGWTGSKAASAATLITRNNKEEHDINVLQDNWKKRADELGFDGEQFVKDALSLQTEKGLFESIKESVFRFFFKKEDLELIQAHEAVDVAIETVSQKTSVFELRQLKEYALKHTLTGNERISHKAIEEVINEKIKNQSLYVGRDPQTQQPALTTPWLLTLEAESLARIETNKGQVKPITTIKEVHNFQSNYEANAKYPLTTSQKQAMTQFLTTNDRYMAIQGYAGTGKTTMLRLTREVAEAAGFDVRGIAVNSSAANELKVKGGINADVFPIVHGELMRAANAGLQKTVFIVDEASMLSSPQGHELIKLIEQKGARLYMVGDDAQLPSVKNGRIFGLSQEYGIQTTEMVDNIRQLNPQLKESVHHAIDGQVYDAVKKINEVREFKTHEERVAAVANSYLQLSHHVRENTLLFAPTHANRREITVIIRDGLKKEGTLGDNQTLLTVLKPKALEEAQLYHAQYYSKGDVIRFNHQSKRYGIERGEYLTVDRVSQEHKRDNALRLIHKNGKAFNFRLNELPAYKPTRAGFSRHIEVYQQEELELADGDRILWTRNFKKEGIANSERALVTSITEECISLTLDSGETKTLNRKHEALQHLDHGYVFTNIKVQGKDKMYGIGMVESYNKFAATLKNFYVQISRGIHSMKLVTDDQNNLIRALEENDDTKKSSIDFVSTNQLKQHQKQFSQSQHSMNIDAVIEKKGMKEEVYHRLISRVEQYRQAKGLENKANSAKIAHEIISNNQLFRLAKSTLGYGYQAYRQDAHRYATYKLKNSLTQEEKNHLNTVRDYIRASQKTKTAWKQAIDINSTSSNKAHAFDESLKRNALAFKIATDIERYKPYLKHYSIGELNRLGIPQHHYERQEEKSLLNLKRLTEHASTHQLHTHVRQFFSEPSSLRPELAAVIKEHSKSAHPYLVKISEEKQTTSDTLWKEVNLEAREHADALFKKTLPEPHQKVFEQIKTYRALGFELGALWKEHVTLLETNQPLTSVIKDKISQITILRNEIASMAIQDKTYLPVLAYFKIDANKLALQAEKNEQRNNVLEYLKSNSHFKNKLNAAERISADIQGHYPFIKECGVDTRQLNKYVRLVTRQQHFSSLSEAELNDYKIVLNYKYESKNAATYWKKIFLLKEQNLKPEPFKLTHALESTSKRDYLASKLISQPQYAGILNKENISIDKLNAQSSNHLNRASEINKINEDRMGLLHRLEQKEGYMNTKESLHWKNSWNLLNQQTTKIVYSKALYGDALKESPLIENQLSKSHINLLEKYELSLKEPLNKIKTNSTSQVHQNINITLTNETLMANPEQTYSLIFGEANTITSREMRYSGGLIVSLKGSKSGLWYDFGSGEGGSPIQAIMREKSVDFKEALAIASEMAGTKNMEHYSSIKTVVKTQSNDEKMEMRNKITSAKSIMKGTIPIDNTLAEQYLIEHRKIENPTSLNVKFWPKNAKWLSLDDHGNLIERNNKIPALVIAAQNEKGDITGVQRIYLDEKTANKNTFMDKAKISKGYIRSSAGILQKGEKFGTVYLVEGPETGASIAMADPKATVLVSFGLSNIQNLSKLIKSYFPNQVIIAGDNDRQPGSKTHELTQKAQESLKQEGINSQINFPKQITSLEKTDWNDVLKVHGVLEVRKQLGIDIPSKNEMNLSQINMDKILNINQSLEDPIKNIGENIKGNHLFIIKEQDRLISFVDKSIQDTITQYTKEKSLSAPTKSIEIPAIKKQDLGLEI
jgi:conjugative transfer relaxase protein TraI